MPKLEVMCAEKKHSEEVSVSSETRCCGLAKWWHLAFFLMESPPTPAAA